ncbi:DUF945 family protein [Acinetobacter sp. ANC 3813]|uniref:DUF945 family protein n=1 Tax=Acinetobacter sp. ANC 3813 TaxID=1977873 RepID=UPI000A346569|nr:DUF945 family protein [Acinetobacter sp. ANC 3813]OTG90770.1 DUF945 domain-containing protein [Acinetobacter sp. ANC 3813]
MSKIILGAGCLLALAASGAGANWYADKKLADYYEHAEISKALEELEVRYSNIQLGMMKGSADWEITLILDPCKPKDVIVLQGKDQIQKKWNGYNIESSFKVKSGSEKIKAALKGEQHIQTHINWMGKTKSTVHLPRIDTQNQGVHMRLEPSLISIYSESAAQDESEVSKVVFELPALTVTEGQIQILAQNIKLDSNQGLGEKEIRDGHTHFSIGAFQRIDKQFSGKFKNFEMLMNTEVKDSRVTLDGSFKIGELTLPSTPLIKDMTINLALSNIKTQDLNSLSAVWDKSQNSCESSELMQADVSQAFLNLVNEGMEFKSENQLSMSDGTASAKLEGKLMPGHQGSLSAFAKMLPNLLSFKANLAFDKNIYRTVMNSYAQASTGKMLTEPDIEQAFSSLEASGQAKRDGDQLKMLLEYQFGQKQFLDPDKN